MPGQKDTSLKVMGSNPGPGKKSALNLSEISTLLIFSCVQVEEVNLT